MDTTHDGGIAVLIALLPILPLAMYLRRRGKREWRRGLVAAGVSSFALLVTGIAIATTHGAF
jgi:hypothetical protein